MLEADSPKQINPDRPGEFSGLRGPPKGSSSGNQSGAGGQFKRAIDQAMKSGERSGMLTNRVKDGLYTLAREFDKDLAGQSEDLGPLTKAWKDMLTAIHDVYGSQ
jgi:hypothetical protein